MEVSRTLDVSGYIKANSYDTTSTVYNGHSGGSGGSIIIKAVNFTGKSLHILQFCDTDDSMVPTIQIIV